MEALACQLSLRNSEVDDLSEKYRVLERERNAAKRDAKAKEELVSSLGDTLHREKGQAELFRKELKETNERLAESLVQNKTLLETVASLRSELKSTVEAHKSNLADFTQSQTKLLSSLKQEHTDKIAAFEKNAADDQCAIASLEHERSVLGREKQSSEKRTLNLEKHLSDREVEHQRQIKALSNRVLDAEAQLDACLSEKLAFKRHISKVEEQLSEAMQANREMELNHNKVAEKLQGQLTSTKQDNEAISNHNQRLQSEIESLRREVNYEKDNMRSEVERQIQDAQVECESLRVSRANEQIKAKQSHDALEKAVNLHKSTVEELRLESNEVRAELEKTISDERNISQVSGMISSTYTPSY